MYREHERKREKRKEGRKGREGKKTKKMIQLVTYLITFTYPPLRGTRDLIANICWIIEKVREFQKNIYFCFIDYGKAFDCVDHKKLWKILKEMGIPDHLTCLLRKL